jgi:hypothetical protein
MPVTFHKGNAVSALIDKRVDYLLNCVNCQGKYASGIAKEIGTRIPTAIRRYNDFYRWKNRNGQKMLGDIAIDGSSGVVHLAAQEFYWYDGKQYVDYTELDSCLIKFAEFYQAR